MSNAETTHFSDVTAAAQKKPANGLADNHDESDSAVNDTGLTDNQNRLLYLVSLYSHVAKSADDKEEWIRKHALLVLIYEGIIAQVFDYDYAPSSEIVESRRKYFNVTQEGKSDLDFLREEGLISALRLSTKAFYPATCYQISEKGEELVKKLSRPEKDAVHDLVYAPNSRELLKVVWDGDTFWLKAANGFARQSTVTDTEDICYVSSAYVPQCLRRGGRPTLSNAHRAHESGLAGSSSLKSQLDELITLNSVSIIVAEYVPFGSNQLVQINYNIGSTERVQGGFLTTGVDVNNGDTQFHVDPELTSVNILDYSLTGHVNFEADIRFPEASDVVQVETFGVALTSDGSCFYGMQIEAMMDRIKDNLSLDQLSRLLVDVHQDSSRILASIVSEHQRELLELVFMGDAMNRDKVNLIIANEITPHLSAEEYLDKGEYENELKQILGDTRAAFDISESDTIIFGANGLMLAGPNSRHHELLLTSYLKFVSLDVFLRNYYGRLFILMDDVATTKNYIQKQAVSDPNSLERTQSIVSSIAQQAFLMSEILGFVDEALAVMKVPAEPPEQAGRSLYERLQIREMKDQLLRRAQELKKNNEVVHNDLSILRELVSFLSEARTARLTQNLESNLKSLCELQGANDRTRRALEIIQVMLGGALLFAVLDRLTGGYTVDDVMWMKTFTTKIIQDLPLIWFLLNILLWGGLGYGLIRLMQWLHWRYEGEAVVRSIVNQHISLANLQQLINTKEVSQEERDYDKDLLIVKVTYRDKDPRPWGGLVPTVTLKYEEKYQFLLSITVKYNKRYAKNKTLVLSGEELRAKIMSDLLNFSVFDDNNGRGLTLAEDRRKPVVSQESSEVKSPKNPQGSGEVSNGGQIDKAQAGGSEAGGGSSPAQVVPVIPGEKTAK